MVIGAEGATGECFDNVDENLATAIEHEQGEFRRAAGDGRDALTGLPAGAAALAVVGAAGAVLGIGRRLSEYR
ncbi:Secreted protein OS=Streptomyces griseomycini OX=66895 GN=FHS37_004978 PE=4 SV=1 [Streptomyces griseomycini]